MKFPATYIELVNGGYVYLSRKRCQVCGDDVILFRTPKGKRAPFVFLQNGKYLSHFATCRSGRKVEDQEKPLVAGRRGPAHRRTCAEARGKKGPKRSAKF
jgi:hypothetical protein